MYVHSRIHREARSQRIQKLHVGIKIKKNVYCNEYKFSYNGYLCSELDIN